MKRRAAGRRSVAFSRSCANVDGGCDMRATSNGAAEPRLRIDIAGATLSRATKLPCRWQARIRSWSITGVCAASDSSNAVSTVSTRCGRSGRGSSRTSDDFIA